MQEREAADILQRVGRGYVGRRKGVEEVLAKLKVQKMMKRVRFARRIQPVCKAYLARRDLVANIKEEAERPIKIMQRFGRAFRTRRIFCRDLAEWKAKRLNAIKAVEAYCRGQRSSRRRAIQFRRAALRIAQCLGRGFLCRRNEIQEIILKRIRKRTRQITLLQSCGRAMLVRTDCKYQRRAQLLQRKKVFVFETQRYWRAFRIRLRLGRRWNVISRANRMRLATLCQRVGQGHFERRMIEPRYRLKKHTDMLAMCATLIQQCGRGMRARTWVGYRFDTAQRRIRKNRIRRETELAAALTLARIGRAFQRRRKCFRRYFKFMKAKRILASVAIGAVSRQRLRNRYHDASLRVRARPETPEGDDEKALRALKKIQQDLKDELMEDQWKIDSLISAGIAQHVPAEILKRKMAARGTRNPEEVYRKRCKQFQRANDILRARLAVKPPEYLASLTAKLTTAESERAKLIRENRKLQGQIDARAPDVHDAEEELNALESTRKKEQAVVDRANKRRSKAEAVATAELEATTKLEEEIEAMIEKLEAVQEFEDEDRPPSARTLRRRATARRLEASRMAQSMTSIVGSPTNAARQLASSNSSTTPPPVLRPGERSIDAPPSAALKQKGDDTDANRLTYHFDSDEEHLDLQPRQRAKSSMELSQSNNNNNRANAGGGGPAKHRSLRLNMSQMSASRAPPSGSSPVFALAPSAKKQNLVDAHYGVCVPMVARMSYAGIPGASVNNTSAAALRGTSLVGSPVRSIRIKPKTQGAGMHQLEPELPALADSFNSWTVREPSALIPVRSESVKRDASVSFAAPASPAGGGGGSAEADKPAASPTNFEPHVVVRTQQDMVYAKVQLQEAEAKIVSLRHDIDRAEHALTEMERRVEAVQRERAADAKRKEKLQRKSQSEEAKRAQQREEDERLQKRLETLQAIAKAEQDAADAAARRAEAEAKLREELAKPREGDSTHRAPAAPGGTKSPASAAASASGTPPPPQAEGRGASEAVSSAASSKRSSVAPSAASKAPVSKAPVPSSKPRKVSEPPAPKRSSGGAAAAAKKGAKSAAEAKPSKDKKQSSPPPEEPPAVAATPPSAATPPPPPAAATAERRQSIAQEPPVTSGAPSAQTSPPPDAGIVPNTTAPPPHAADEYSDDDFADEVDDGESKAAPAASGAGTVKAPVPARRTSAISSDLVDDEVATPSLGSSIGSSIPPTPSDLSQSM